MIRAGSAQVDITPPLGTHLAGDGAGIRRPARRALDPLHAKAVVIESKGRRMAAEAGRLCAEILASPGTAVRGIGERG